MWKPVFLKVRKLETFGSLSVWQFGHLDFWKIEGLRVWGLKVCMFGSLIFDHLNIRTFESWVVEWLKVCKFEFLKFESSSVWKFEDLKVWVFDSLGIWNFWKCERWTIWKFWSSQVSIIIILIIMPVPYTSTFRVFKFCRSHGLQFSWVFKCSDSIPTAGSHSTACSCAPWCPPWAGAGWSQRRGEYLYRKQVLLFWCSD